MTSSTSTVSIEAMRPRLRTIGQVQNILAATEPLTIHGFTVGDSVRFTVADGWQHGITAKAGTEPVAATITIGRGAGTLRFPLTKDALLEAATVCGLPRRYAVTCPAGLLEPQLNYWYREGLATRIRRNNPTRDFQLLAAAGHGAAITRATLTPFSNLRLLEQALTGITNRYGADTEVLVDYKLTHTITGTRLRLVVPEHTRTITGTDTQDDIWSVGLQIRNALTGREPTSIDGYLFRWVCTNGAISTAATSGTYSRRANTTAEQAYAWAAQAVDAVLGGLEPVLDGVQNLTTVPIRGHVNEVLRDVFEHYRVPVAERTRIIEAMAETGGELSMYAVMAAITQAANATDLDPAQVENLLRLGGDLPHAAHSRCAACRRLLR